MTADRLPTCPYCGQPVGRTQLESIRNAENERTTELTKALEPEIRARVDEERQRWEAEKADAINREREGYEARFLALKASVEAAEEDALRAKERVAAIER